MGMDFTCKRCGYEHETEARIASLKNQRDWLFAILIGTVMALTFVIHVITMEMPR